MGGRGLGGGWGRKGRWSPCFSRQFNNWELDEVESTFWKLQLVDLESVSQLCVEILGTSEGQLLCMGSVMG
ncbi:hypothetical protein CK203_079313 [Vitis vinifera]|uniref:Uncharacterized protein n=1 Tax=Vitis vinifera TaxID=29760 RepID=A0A438DGQ2_VITVI|nr:hypothetical protein CK203_079313 [Vitis vinifera]